MKHRDRKSAIFKASLEVDFSSELSQAYYGHLSQASDKSWARRCLLEMTTVENMFIIRLRSRYFYKPFTASASCSNACVRMLRGVLLVHMLVVKDQLFQSLWSLVISHFRFWEWKSVLYIFIQRAILGYYCLTGENGLTVVCLFLVSMQSTCALRWYLVCDWYTWN